MVRDTCYVANTNYPRHPLFRSLSTIGPILGMFAASVCVLFGIFYWLITGYLVHEVDGRLTRETTQLIKRTPDDARKNIDDRGKREASNVRPYGYFDAAGRPLTGNILALPSKLIDWKPFQYTQLVKDHNGREIMHFRAVSATYANGERVVVGQGIDDMQRFDTLLIRIALGGLAGTILLGAGCGIALNAASNRRIRAIRESCQEIISSHFERRLPVRGSNDDVDLLVVIVNTMLDDIERLVHELRGVCAWIAHDLRTPMTSLRAGLERARRNSVEPAEYAGAIDQAIIQSDRVLTRFSALLRIAEIEAHAQRASFRQIDLCEILRDVAEFYEPLADERGVRMMVETPLAPTPSRALSSLTPEGSAHRISEGLACGDRLGGASDASRNVGTSLIGDRDLLFGAIENLLDNSLKFTPAGGAVNLRLYLQDKDIVVEVSDTGPGIPQAEREAVLRPFYRSAQLSGMPKPGHGLGLSLVAATARLHGATLLIADGEPGCQVQMRFAAKS